MQACANPGSDAQPSPGQCNLGCNLHPDSAAFTRTGQPLPCRPDPLLSPPITTHLLHSVHGLVTTPGLVLDLTPVKFLAFASEPLGGESWPRHCTSSPPATATSISYVRLPPPTAPNAAETRCRSITPPRANPPATGSAPAWYPCRAPVPARSPSAPGRKSGRCQRVPRSANSRWPHCSGKGCTPTPSTSPTTPWAVEPNRPWPSKPPTWAADSPCAPAKPSSSGHWPWPTANTTPGCTRSGIPRSA